MFAVPGWSVDSSNLKTQKPKPSTPALNAIAVAQKEGTDATEKPGKKRKRSNGKSKASDVNATNLADLWETVIEGKTKEKEVTEEKTKAKGTGEKRQKISKDGEAEGAEEKVIDGRPKKLKTLKEKKKEKKAALAQIESGEAPKHSPLASAPAAKPPSPPKPVSYLTPLQASMRQKLVSARFRHLNQTLYTTPSAHSIKLFEESPEMFQEYHEGFRRQVEVWPENPVDGYIQQLKTRGMARRDMRKASAEVKSSNAIPLPRTVGTCYVADLGCGDAGLAQGLKKDLKKLNLQIYSYDLQNPSPLVTKADIANLPLEDGSVDVAIFCLALMGTNWIDFIEEAYRILHWKGELWVAEIKSRFGRVGGQKGRVEHSVGKRDKREIKKMQEEGDERDLAVEVDGEVDSKAQETDVTAFVEVLKKRGFILQGEPDLRNRMFVKMHFVKGATPIKGKCVPLPEGMEKMGLESWKKKPKFIDEEDGPVSSEAGVLKPCVYKLR
jgi:ribosomal RNA-processing protein 8